VPVFADPFAQSAKYATEVPYAAQMGSRTEPDNWALAFSVYWQCERRVVAPEQGSMVSQTARGRPTPWIGYTASVGRSNRVKPGAASDLSRRRTYACELLSNRTNEE